ncbi:LOW QUALITY PROTEIN: lipase lipH, partial [Mycobacterium tuberculosis T92]
AAIEDAWPHRGWSRAWSQVGADLGRIAVARDSAGGTIRRGDRAASPRYGRPAHCVSAVVVSLHSVGPIAAVVGRECRRTDPRRQGNCRVLPLVRRRNRLAQPASANGARPSGEPGRPAAGLHRCRRLRPFARRRDSVRRAAGRRRCSRRGAQRPDAGARLRWLCRCGARRHRGHQPWAGGATGCATRI